MYGDTESVGIVDSAEANGPTSYAWQLISQLEAGAIPIDPHGDESLKKIIKWQAFRQSKREWLALHVRWAPMRPYKVDSLPKRISVAFGDFLFGHDPVFTAANPKDTESLNAIIDENKLPSFLRRAADRSSAEGEVWWRLRVDKSTSEYPMIDWWSRLEVRPMFSGYKLVAVAFVVDYGTNSAGRWRLLEVHEDGAVYNRLYLCPAIGENATFNKNDANAPERKLGDNVSLASRPDTASIVDEFRHGLPGMLAGRVVNELYDDCTIGVSDYDGIEDMFLDLNEAHAIDAENFRLAGKKRAIMPRRYANQRQASGAALVDASEDILFSEDDSDEMDSTDGPFKILEYTYDSAGSLARKADLMTTALTRVGLALQVVDANADAAKGVAAVSGVALRIKLMPTIAAADGKAREWVDGMPYMLRQAIKLDALDIGAGGFGRDYTDPDGLPVMVLADPIPPDPGELATRHAAMVVAKIESMETAIEDLNPDWSPERMQLEIERILIAGEGYALDVNGKIVNPPPNPDAVVDNVAEANLHVALVGGELEAVETGVETLHPNWPPARVKLEIQRILADRQGYGLTLQGEVINPPKDPDAVPPGGSIGGVPPAPQQYGGGGQQDEQGPTTDQVAAGADPGRFAWGPGDIQSE